MGNQWSKIISTPNYYLKKKTSWLGLGSTLVCMIALSFLICVVCFEYPKAMRSPVLLIIILFILICFGAGGTQGQTRRIADDEMAALSEIAQQLGKKDWNLSLNECDENGNWHTPVMDGLYNSTINCTCLGDGCHISAMYASIPF
ncbi:hypothetical protein RHSIM_Rhsim02G0089400 [Rhododendron simsii]|uniref:Uncharacterized protein n=1 Tax=Rhododendron simsii TaxID=118357 RepID=A0A834HDY4_RHOSS|nr:hypothetical protein RHSIM_Rhsim02G0089400 [Rhododendron simsii]